MISGTSHVESPLHETDAVVCDARRVGGDRRSICLPDLKSQGSMPSKSFTSSLPPLETAFPSHPFHSSCSKWTIQIPGWIRIFRPAFHKGGGLEISEPPHSRPERRKRSHDVLKLDGAERNSDSLLWSSNRKTLPAHSGGE